MSFWDSIRRFFGLDDLELPPPKIASVLQCPPEPKWMAPIRPFIEKMCAANDVPLGVVIGWIQVESGGDLRTVTRYGERGYFQIMPSESKDLGIADLPRLSTDPEYSLAWGFKLVNKYRNFIAMKHMPEVADGSEYHWRLVKLAHSFGEGATARVLSDAIRDGKAGSWELLSTYCDKKNDEYFRSLNHSPARWITFVDKMFEVGRPFGVCKAGT